MSRQLGIKEMIEGKRANVPVRKQPISFASYRARIFCKECNTHFKHLEDAVIPLLVPMAKGHMLSLAAREKRTLGLWAAKTGLALLAASSPEIHGDVPKDHHHTVRYTGRPHHHVWVGYFPWKGGTVIHGAEGTTVALSQNPPTRQEGRTYISLFAFAKLAFKITGFIDPPPGGTRIGSGRYPVCQFWPETRGLVHWPPPLSPPAHNADLEGLTVFTPLIPPR